MSSSGRIYTIEKSKPFYSTLNNLIKSYHFPTGGNQANLTKFYVKFTIVNVVCLMVFCGASWLHLIMALKDNTGLDLSEDLSVNIGDVGSTIVCTMFTLQYGKWSDFFNNAADISIFGKPADFDAVMKRNNIFSTVLFWYVNFGIIFYAALSQAEAPGCRRLNEEKGLHEICGTFIPIWLPFEVNKLEVLIILAAQIIMGFFFLSPSMIICFLPWESTQIVISHMNHFKSNFLKVFEESTFQERRDRLRFCIQYHIHILRMMDQLNDLVKSTVGIMTLICALVFGCIENQIFKSKPLGAVVYLIAYMGALFLLSHAGQTVEDESLSISDILYDVNWYEVEVSIMKDLKLIIARAQKPNRLDALPIGNLNYVLFITILKTSYSYLTLLNQTS